MNFKKAVVGGIFAYRKQVCRVDFFLHCLFLEELIGIKELLCINTIYRRYRYI